MWTQEEYRAYHRSYYHNVTKKNPTAHKAKLLSGTFARRKAKYGITREEYYMHLTRQEGRCDICQEFIGEDLRVDHDHTTGKVRALLCDTCNAGLGQFHESPTNLRAAASYLERFQKEH